MKAELMGVREMTEYQGWGGKPVQYGADDALLCPDCGDSYLHQGKVEIFDKKQGPKRGIHTVAGTGETRIDTDMRGNPSDRRQGLIIWFRCEQCDRTPRQRLGIWQHKGNTTLEWLESVEVESVPEEEEEESC